MVPERRRAPWGLAARLVAGLAVVLLAGCNWYYDRLPSPDDVVKLVPWFDHMIDSRAVFPYETADVPRRAVPGTVPVHDEEGDWGTGDPARLVYAFDTLVANTLPNPLRPDELTARGDTLYQFFCATCHGSAGVGDGLVGRRMAAPSLLTPRARALADGYLYSIIRYGRGVMPFYGDKVFRTRDRWAIVNHVRQLQSAAPAGATP